MATTKKDKGTAESTNGQSDGAIADTSPPVGQHFTESSTAATAPDPKVDEVFADPAYDREQELANMEAAGLVADDSGESDHDDSAAPKKERIPMEDFARAGWSDADEAINIIGILQGYVERGGTIDVSVLINFQCQADPDLAGELTGVVKSRAFSAHYAGRELGMGAQVEKFTVKADADGNQLMDIVVRMPETQRHFLKNIVGLARSKGVLALSPEQMELPVTYQE